MKIVSLFLTARFNFASSNVIVNLDWNIGNFKCPMLIKGLGPPRYLFHFSLFLYYYNHNSMALNTSWHVLLKKIGDLLIIFLDDKMLIFVYFVDSLKMGTAERIALWLWRREWIRLIHNPWIVFLDINFILKVCMDSLTLIYKRKNTRKKEAQHSKVPEVFGKAFEGF